MDSFISALIIAVIQGITEWLPVSSSGHIVLFSEIFNYPNTIAFDAALHFGTLMAVFVYFGKDIIEIVEDFLKFRTKSPNFRMGILLIVSAIPAAVIGYLFKSFFEAAFSSLGIVAIGFGITALVLLISSLDFRGKNIKKESLGYGRAFLIGIAQAIAIIPGISRSGATISSGLLAGLSEKDAVKFSFLMAIPVIFGANLVAIGNKRLPGEMIWATLLAFAVGLLAIHLMLKIISNSRRNLRWFALYCLLLALGIGVYLIF